MRQGAMPAGFAGLSCLTMTANLKLLPLQLSGLTLVQRNQLTDSRGHFARLFSYGELKEAGWTRPVRQINHSFTQKRGTVRGLHFQHAPHAETKLVTCLHGAIWDVGVDLRRDSPTFLQWHAEHLSADNANALLLPAGFAHGFQTLTDDVELLYVHDHDYVTASDDGINPLEPRCAIHWPLPVESLSDKDAMRPLLSVDFSGIST